MKIKKILMAVALTIITLSSSLVLFACGNGASAEETLKLYSDFVSTVEANEDGVFTSINYAFVTSSYSFDKYYEKTENGGMELGEVHTRLSATQAMEFIIEYKDYFTSFEGEYDFNNMKTQGDELVKSYSVVVEEYKELNQMTELNYNIYNGQVARYRVACQNFTKELYDVQNAVIDYLENGVKLTTISAESTAEEKAIANRFEIKKQLLLTNEDFTKLFMNSYQAKPEGTNAEYTRLLVKFTEFINFSKSTLTKVSESYTDEQIASVKSHLASLASSRANTREAINNFSFYTYLNDYQGNIELYNSVNDKAEASYNQIITYFYDDEGPLQKTEAYINAL